MKKILIIDNSLLDYTGYDVDGKILRGTETSLIFLSEAFAKMNYLVNFVNNTSKEIVVNNVNYFNYNNNDVKKHFYDLAVAVSDANFLNDYNSLKKIVFSVSNQPLEKFIRKKQLFPFFKNKPCVVTLCKYQYDKRSFLTSFFGKKLIPITVDPKFFYENIDLNYIPEKKTFYNIRSNRNLDPLIKIWIKYIHQQNPNATFEITPNLIKNAYDLKKFNIFERQIVSRQNLIDSIKKYRALLYLGHKSDIFTLTVEEAIKLCVPVITYGIGSVSERVNHGVTGFIAKSEKEFSDYTNLVLNDDKFYINLKKKMFNNRQLVTWDSIANIWKSYFLLENN